MSQAHLMALKKKHEDIEKKIHAETAHAARNEQMIRQLKEQRLHVKEEIAEIEKRK